MIPEEKIIIALDTQEEAHVTRLFNALRGHRVWVKIGMELYYAHGPKFVHEAKERGFNVFLDLKLHDIPNTVTKSLKVLSKLPIDMINVHAAGGSEMMKKAAEVIRTQNDKTLLIAVTQLTSTTDQMMNKEQRISGDVLESVVHYAKMAKESGCHGVVSSPLEVEAIKLVCGSKFLVVTPGIRPRDAESNDQARFTTPMEALRKGVDYMVIGRPITQAASPVLALDNILKGN